MVCLQLHYRAGYPQAPQSRLLAASSAPLVLSEYFSYGIRLMQCLVPRTREVPGTGRFCAGSVTFILLYSCHKDYLRIHECITQQNASLTFAVKKRSRKAADLITILNPFGLVNRRGFSVYYGVVEPSVWPGCKSYSGLREPAALRCERLLTAAEHNRTIWIPLCSAHRNGCSQSPRRVH